MEYDSDKTALIIDQIKDALRDDQIKTAMQLLRHADAGSKFRSDGGLLTALRNAAGKDQAAALVEAFAFNHCPYCRGGRDNCPDCDGKGFFSGAKVCRPCAGLGLRRCPLCNGTSLAGYDFVPRGLRQSVLMARLSFAEKHIESFGRRKAGRHDGIRDIAREILSIDRCRGVLANAVEQIRLNEQGAPGRQSIYTSADRLKVERDCRRLNGMAESTIRGLLGALAGAYATKAENTREDVTKRRLLAHRAKVFGLLGGSDGFGESALRTPEALQRI